VGVDNIDLDAATRQGHRSDEHSRCKRRSVADHTLGMMLAMARHLCRADALMHAGRWEKKSCKARNYAARTLGIAGLGPSAWK